MEVVFSTVIKPTKEKLKKILAHYGIPKQVQSDNCPPFNTKEFAAFAEEGFQHHRVTPQHPRANGQAERFMHILKKKKQQKKLPISKSQVKFANAIMHNRVKKEDIEKTGGETLLTNTSSADQPSNEPLQPRDSPE